MNDKIGRNNPCPCGSGKKYKKCCLHKDEAKRREEQAAKAPGQGIAPDPPNGSLSELKTAASARDPLLEKQDALFDEFQSQGYEQRIDIFLGAIDEPGVMDAGLAFEMLSRIFDETAVNNDQARFNDLLEALQRKLPKVYVKNEAYCLDWWISNALALNQPEVLTAKFQEFAEIAYKHIDTFNRTLDCLSYHGHLQLLLKAARIAWPRVETSTHIVPWGINEFAAKAIDFEIFAYLEVCAQPKPDDPDLQDRLKPFIKGARMDVVSETVEHLAAHAGRRWSRDDFKDSKAETFGIDLVYLSREFLGELYRKQGVSFTKGELGRNRLVTYLLERADGDLEPKPSMMEAFMGGKKWRKPKAKQPPPHMLCPDRESSDRFLARTLDFINPQTFKAAAFFELIPDWLRFLESRALIDEGLHARTLKELHPVAENLEKIINEHYCDPALRLTIKGF